MLCSSRASKYFSKEQGAASFSAASVVSASHSISQVKTEWRRKYLNDFLLAHSPKLNPVITPSFTDRRGFFSIMIRTTHRRGSQTRTMTSKTLPTTDKHGSGKSKLRGLPRIEFVLIRVIRVKALPNPCFSLAKTVFLPRRNVVLRHDE